MKNSSSREPFTVADGEIAGLELVAQLEEQGALPDRVPVRPGWQMIAGD